MTIEPVRYMTELAPRLYDYFSMFGVKREVRCKRDYALWLRAIHLPLIVGETEEDRTTIEYIISLNEERSIFCVWDTLPGTEDTRTTQWSSPNPILKVNSGGRDRREWTEEKGTLFVDCVKLDFGHFNNALDLAKLTHVVISREVIRVAALLLRDVKPQTFWEIERFPNRKRFQQSPA